jgi:RNA polymerase sigma-70 factor (ECF subfamily)
MPTTSLATTDSATLAIRAAAGDAGSFESLYHRHAPEVYGQCLRMVRDEQAAAELTQDVFVRAWSQLAHFDGGNFGGWLHAVGRNVVLNDRRARGRIARHLSYEGDLAAVEPLGGRVSHETLLSLRAAIEGLPPIGRRVFELHDVEGFSHEEIGRLLRIAPATSRVHLFRARKTLGALVTA